MAESDTPGAGRPERDADIPFTHIVERMPELAALAEDEADIVRIEVPIPSAPAGTRLVVEVPRAIAPFLEEQLRPERIEAIVRLMEATSTLLEPPE